MKKNIFTLSLSVFLTIMLPSCFKMPRYRPMDLESLSGRPHDARKIDNVVMKLKVLTPKECQIVFGKRGGHILRNRPETRVATCHLSIKNKTDRILILDPKDISIPLIPTDRIIKRVQVYSTHRWLPAITMSTIASPALNAVPPIAVLNGCSFLGMIKWSYYNEDLSMDVQEKALARPITIYPNQQIDKLLFIKEKYIKKGPLSVTLYDEDDYSYALTFNLNTK